ncbi:E3 ubiquitin ligase PQT3-like [Apium graveolens]|uniref:E3 ubiquitin ligase PQT3-like n=1 Tax=Apium graveolens TaxID=4045 RepID=UPI003D7A1DDA
MTVILRRKRFIIEVYYKFKSAKDFDSIPIGCHYTTVSYLKQYIFKKKCSGKRRNTTTKFDKLILTNAQTNEEYLHDETLIHANTSIIVRRVPYCSFLPIVITPPVAAADEEDNVVAASKLKKDVQVTKNNIDKPSVSMYPYEFEWDELWNYLSPPKIVVQVQDVSLSKADEDSRIRALIHTPTLDWQCQNTTHCSSGAGRGFGCGGLGGRIGGRGFGRGGLLEQMTPPASYICHRCKVPGHFIQHCPTNGDPTFDVKRTKPPTGIPHSMLTASPDGSYILPNGDVAVLKPNEDAFEKEIQGIPSTCSVPDLPAELYCPLCSAAMKDAVFTSKCCFKSYCDKCIRDYIISKSMCICGATKVLADDLLPNNTLRDTILRFLESGNCSGANVMGASRPQITEPAQCLLLKSPSSTLSAASKGVVLASKSEGNTKVEDMTEPAEVDNVTQKTLGQVIVGKGAEVSEVAQGCGREPVSQICAQVTDEKMQQQKPASREVGKKRKKYADMQSRPHQEFAADNYLMPTGTTYHSPFWNIMQFKFDGFGRPCGGQMPFMGYDLGPTSTLFGGALHHGPFGEQVCIRPFPPQRDLPEFEMGLNGCGGPPIMSREETEAPKTNKKQKRDLERSGGNVEVSRDRNSCRDMIGREHVPSVTPQCSTHDPELVHTSSKRKVNHDNYNYDEHTHQPRKKLRLHHHESEFVSATRTAIPSNTVDLPLPSQASTFPEGHAAVVKKTKLGSSSPAINGSSPHRSHTMTSNKYHEDHHKAAAAAVSNRYEYYAEHHDYESSDDDRNFKRRPSRYDSSPTTALKERKHSNRRWREEGVMAASIGRLSVY